MSVDAMPVDLVYRPASRRGDSSGLRTHVMTGNFHASASICLKFILKSVSSRIDYLIR